METIREIIFSREFDEFYHNLDERTQEKYDYAFDMIRTQYIVNKRFVKSLENTDFYELRISIGHNEYRSIMLAIDQSWQLYSSTSCSCSKLFFEERF